MKTTLVLPDGLVHAAKARAAEQGRSLSAWVAFAMETVLAGPAPGPGKVPFTLVTYRGDGLQPGVSWAALHEVEAREDAERLARVTRAAP